MKTINSSRCHVCDVNLILLIGWWWWKLRRENLLCNVSGALCVVYLTYLTNNKSRWQNVWNVSKNSPAVVSNSVAFNFPNIMFHKLKRNRRRNWDCQMIVYELRRLETRWNLIVYLECFSNLVFLSIYANFKMSRHQNAIFLSFLDRFQNQLLKCPRARLALEAS